MKLVGRSARNLSMKRNSYIPLMFWALLAVALVIFFNIYPEVAARIPTVPIVLLFALSAFGFYRISQNRRLLWSEPFYRGITPKHCILLSVIFFAGSFLWLVIGLRFIEHKVDELQIFVVAPVLALIVCGSASLSLGYYFSRIERK